MRKILHLLRLAVLMATPVVAGAQCVPSVALSGDSTGTAYNMPVNTYFNYSLVEMIFDADELGGPMTIDTIGFYFASQNVMSRATNVQIYIMYTDREEFASSTDYQVVDATAVMVYSGALNCSHGWNNFALSTPFNYDGDGNLMVVVHDNLTGYDGASYRFATSSTGDAYKTLERHGDILNPDPTLMAYGGTVPGSRFAYRPVMRLAGCEAAAPACHRVKNLSVTDATTNSITLGWTDTLNTGASYSVYMNVDGVDSLLASGFSNTTYTATGLAASTAYVFSVVADCGSGEASLPVMVSGRTDCGAIDVLPQSWSFEDAELQGSTNMLRLPWCMTRYASGTGGYTYYPFSSGTGWADPRTGSRYLVFYPGAPATYPDTQAVVLPPVDVTVYPMNGNRVTFWARMARMSGTSYSALVNVGTVASLADMSSFVLLDTVRVAGDQYQQFRVSLAESPATNAYVVLAVLRSGDNGGYSLLLDDLTLEQQPLCADVTHLTVDSVSSSTVSLSWDEVAGATFEVYDMADTSVIDTLVAVNHYTVTGLSANTTYTFGVRAVCPTGDGQVTIVSAVTACSAVSLPLTEDFENALTFACWTTANTHSSTGLTTTSAYSGSQSFRFYYTTNPPQYLISPELEGGANGVTVEFSYANYSNSYPESFAVGYSTGGNAPEAFTWLPEVTGVATGGNYVRYSEIVAVPGIRYVAIKHTSNDQYYLFVDSVVIGEALSCQPVTALTVDSVTASSVFLSWNHGGGSAVTYDIFMDTVEVANGVSDTHYEVSDLEGSTTYTFSVVAHCTETDVSPAATVSAMTDCGEGSCQLTFQVNDYYADGWQGAYIGVVQSGIEMGTVTCQGSNESYTVRVCSGVPVSLMWHVGTADEETMFTVLDGGGAVAYACTTEVANTFSPAAPFATLASPCPACLVPIVTVDSVSSDEVFVSWTSGNAIAYNIYINDTILEAQGVTDNHYAINALEPSTGYVIGVQAICSDGDTSGLGTALAFTECAGGPCEIVIATGQYGLLGASIDVLQGGALVDNFYDASAGAVTHTVSVCGGAPISFVYHQTPYASFGYAGMISFTITNGGGEQVYECLSATNLHEGETFLTLDDACPSCATPQVELVSATETTATIRWSATAASYAVYRDSVLVQAGVSDTFYTFTGLSASTGYVFGVVAVCSTTDSSGRADVSVLTPCGTVTALPYAENFDESLGCWTTVNNSADGLPWFWQSSGSDLAAHSGGGMALSVSYNYPDPVHADTWLVSPQIALPAAGSDSIVLSWWYRVDGNYPDDRYEVRLSTTGSDVAAFTTQLADVQPTAVNDSWTHLMVNLTPYAGQSVHIAFHHYNSYDADILAIDDVEIYEGIYTEPEPDTLVVVFEVDDATMGTTVPAPGTYLYGEGDTIFFGSYAVDGHRFARWEITYIADGQSETDTLDAEYANGYYIPAVYWMEMDTVVFRAYFEVGRPDSTTATYAVNDASMGTTIPAPGTYTIYVGDSITAAARANAGYELAYWTLATHRLGSVVSVDTFAAVNPVFFGILPQGYADYDATITITAVFQASTATQHMVTLLSADSTMGRVVPAGVSAVNEGSSFTATAYPEAGYHFVAWTNGSGQVSTANPYVFTVTADVTLTATFEANDTVVAYYEFSVVSESTQQGAVSSNVPVGQVAGGTVVTVTATPAEGYHFLYWVDINYQLVSSDNPYTFTVSGDVSLVAVFEADPTQGIGDVDDAGANIYSADGKIVVEGAENREIHVYDVNGRVVCRVVAAAGSEAIAVSATGVYLVKVGKAPARRVVVVR